MHINKQEKITFINTCNCIVDYELLEEAILWYVTRKTLKRKKIFMQGTYPAVSLFNRNIHVHRLLKSFEQKRKLDKKEYVHHKDGNKLNASLENLEIMQAEKHQSKHNKDKSCIDITGLQFDRLTVIKKVGKDKFNNVLWLCKCQCGNETIVSTSKLKSKNTRSCGCLHKDLLIEQNKKRGI